MKTSSIPRKKSAILAALEKLGTSRYYERHRWLFCFDVKCRSLDLSFDNLVKRVIAMGYGDTVEPEDPFWLADARSRHADNSQHLFEWGVEDARRHFRSNMKSDRVPGAPWYASHYPDGDCYCSLPNGDQVDARFAFLGRSGGWLVLTMFDGVTLDADTDLAECDYRWLRRLLTFLTDLAGSIAHPEQWVEEAAAFTFFANLCDDCETRESRITAWSLDQSGEHC